MERIYKFEEGAGECISANINPPEVMERLLKELCKETRGTDGVDRLKSGTRVEHRNYPN